MFADHPNYRTKRYYFLSSLMVAPKLFSNPGAKAHFLALGRERHQIVNNFGATIRDGLSFIDSYPHTKVRGYYL